MMTKYEAAKQILADNNLPPKQVDNLEILERQVLDLALKLYLTRAKNLDDISLEDAKTLIRTLNGTRHGVAVFMLVVAADIHNFRMATLRRYLDVPPEMQIDDIISRLATRDCDSTHNDAIGDVVYGGQKSQEKGKEEGKEEKSPHTPLKEKGKEEREKERVTSACAREDKKKLREEKKRKEAELRKNDKAFQDFFKTLWEKYPKGRKNLKEKCEEKIWEHYQSSENKDSFFAMVLASLDEHVKCSQWKRKIIPLSSTWFNQHRWTEAAPNDFGDTRKVSGVSQTANVKSNRAGGLW